MKNEKELAVNGSGSDAKKKKFRIPNHWIAIAAFVGIFAVFVGFTLAFRRDSDAARLEYKPTSRITKEEMTLIVKDLNPMQQKMLTENPEQRKQLSDEIKRLLAIAMQANRDGISSKEHIRNELRFIATAILANNYDQKVNKQQGPQAQQFATVTEDEVKAYWNAEDVEPGLLDSVGLRSESPESREKEFQDFIAAKLAIARESGQMPEDAQPSDEELKMAKDIFAKTQIMYSKAEEKLASIPELPGEEKKDWREFEKSTNLQTKLQQAQFLAQYYGQNVLSKKLEISDDDLQKYLADNPEIGDASGKKARAEEVIRKLGEGGDFAELAKEYSEDPGSKENGGLYEDVRTGQMNSTFEKAALALEPGDYTKTPVETDFGYHVIKLVGKNEVKDDKGESATEYDVRHILISTQVSDPKNPISRPMPAKEFARSQLRAEREKEVLDEIMAKNPVSVPTDFEIPKVSDEKLQEMMQQQRGPMTPPAPQPPAEKGVEE